ncbi:MAG TPA: protein kinase [Bacteroidales bacterium]|nr:protein kinase [Bacteroidales bacterium]HOE03803.1 protein kinase [Bacteroidales bacterium]HQL69504.1 protein kinase [Bacteroidales bacterium]
MSIENARLLKGTQHSYIYYPGETSFIISKGRFALVYPALMMPEKKKVICKQLHPGLVGNDENRFRFLLEASVQTDSDTIVKNLDLIANDDGLFLIQEYVEGIDMHNYLASMRISKQRRETEVIKLTLSILNSLIPLHEAGYIHCGLKPSSILVTRPPTAENDFPEVKLIDLYLCQSNKLIPPQNTSPRTPYNIKYSAPELLLRHNNLVNPSTDLFSLGILLFEYVAGVAPHKFTNPIQMVQMQVSAPIPSHDHISDRLMSVILKACEKPAFRQAPGAYSHQQARELIAESMQYRYAGCKSMAVDLLKIL